MTDLAPNEPAPIASSGHIRSFLTNEWPYLAILGLALFGVAYTSVARQPIMIYWLVLAPFIGITSVLTRWREVHGQELRLRLIWTHVLHWGAVLAAMNLIFVADVGQMMSADAKALAALTLLALGTFLDGVHAGAWRLCLVGIILAAGVPAIAWLEQSALLLVLVALVLIGLTAPLWLRDRKGIKKAAN
jgi:hypothetical protein